MPRNTGRIVRTLDFNLGERVFQEATLVTFGLLRQRDQAILYQRFKQHHTLQQIATELGIGRERVRQLQNLAIGRLARLNAHDYWGMEQATVSVK